MIGKIGGPYGQTTSIGRNAESQLLQVIRQERKYIIGLRRDATSYQPRRSSAPNPIVVILVNADRSLEYKSESPGPTDGVCLKIRTSTMRADE